MDKQCCKAANEANRKLGMIKRGFKNKSKEIMLPLYKSMVRPHLDYCIQAWKPHLRKDVDRLEKSSEKGYEDDGGAGGSGVFGKIENLKFNDTGNKIS